MQFLNVNNIKKLYYVVHKLRMSHCSRCRVCLCSGAGVVPDVGCSSGAGDDALVRRDRGGRQRRALQRLSVSGVHEPDPGADGVRSVVCPVQTAPSRCAHVQILLRFTVQHPQQLVPV